jgi:NADH-quinone oxidoreductase subunit N
LGEAFAATVTYIVIYAFMNLGAFAVVIAGARKTGTGEIAGWGGLGSYAPGLGLLAAAFFFSLAGIPPLAGWIAKLVMFSAAMGAGSSWMVVLAAIAAVNAVIALFYYARVVKTIWMDPIPATAPDEAVRTGAVAASLSLALGLSVAVVVAVGFFPSLITFFSDATKALAGG